MYQISTSFSLPLLSIMIKAQYEVSPRWQYKREGSSNKKPLIWGLFIHTQRSLAFGSRKIKDTNFSPDSYHLWGCILSCKTEGGHSLYLAELLKLQIAYIKHLAPNCDYYRYLP